jgi:chaperone required for assembly of F1-ATPase
MRFYAPDKMTAQERAAKFIIFAIKQAKDAEAFGFTRNECCRNLKTAIHQYWQNKVLKLHGQVHKARMLRSEAALNAPDSECVVEHVMPQMEIVNRLMDMQPLTEQGVIELLTQYLKVVIITRDEHASLNSSELRSTMPTDWDGRDVFDRYTKMGIKLAAAEIRNDRNA